MNRREDIAWAAGFLVGEGWVTNTSRRGSAFRGIVLACEQVEREPLERLQAVFGGAISAPRFKPNRQPIYKWTLCNFAEAQNAIAQMWSWLSPRRRAQWGACLKAASGSVMKWQACLHAGHSVSPNSQGYMICKEKNRRGRDGKHTSRGLPLLSPEGLPAPAPALVP